MGLRDALKAKVKAALFGASGPSPAGPSAAPPAASAPPAAAAAVAPPAPIRAPSPPTVVAPAAAPLGAPRVGGAPGSYRAVGPAGAVQEGKPGTFSLDGQVVAVFRHQGRLYAMENACAHEDGPIGEGEVRGTCVVCPYHDWQYDFTTGACITDPERPRATWSVREEGGQVWLGPQLSAGSDSRGGEHDDGMEVIRT